MPTIKTKKSKSPKKKTASKKSDYSLLDVRPGYTIRVYQKIKEKDKQRIQVFEGLVIAKKHGSEPGATVTVRKVFQGIGVEHVFPIYSPLVSKVEIVKRGRVRRAKLYYMRDLTGKAARLKEIKK